MMSVSNCTTDATISDIVSSCCKSIQTVVIIYRLADISVCVCVCVCVCLLYYTYILLLCRL